MKKILASILAGVSLAYGNFTRADDLPTQIEPRNGKYYTTDQVTLEVKDMALRKVIDKSQNQPIFMQGNYTPDGRVSLSYSTHPFEEKATRPKQGFASNSKVFVGLPEGAKIELIMQKAETIGNFDRVTETELKPLEQTRYAKTFLKMGNNGIEKLRGYDPIQKITSSLNDSIFLVTGTDLNLEDKLSIYGGLKAFSDHLTTQEKERGKATFKGELELQEIPLYPHDGIIQPSETKRKIMFRIQPGTYTGERIPFTVYQKLVLGREATEGIGKLETFFNGEIDNPNEQRENNREEWVIFITPERGLQALINLKQNTAKVNLGGVLGREHICTGMEKIPQGYKLSMQQRNHPQNRREIVIEKEDNQWYIKTEEKNRKDPLIIIDSLSKFIQVYQMADSN